MSSIQTFSTEAFRNRFIENGQQTNSLLKTDFGKFFVVKVEEMIRLMKLPVPPTKATNHTLIFLHQGYIEMTIGFTKYRIQKQQCLVVPAGSVFSIGEVDVNSGKGYLFVFHNDMVLGKHDLVWGNPAISLPATTARYVLLLCKRMHTQYRQNGLQNLKLLQSYFVAMLCELETAYQPVSNNAKTKSLHLTNRFKELLYKHIKTKHRVSEYAALLHITPNHLNKVVKQITGQSPTRWIDETLIMEAKVLLHHTDYTVNEIANKIGVLDQSYFSRLFKKYEKRTPLEFRKKIERS